MSTPSTPLATRARSQTPGNWYPQLNGLELPQQLTSGITQAFQLVYANRDQTTQNTDSINHMVQYGTMQQRLAAAPTALPDGALWYVTDYPNAVYQVRMDPKMNQLAWFYATGVIWQEPAGGTPGFSPGLNDAGLMWVSGAGILYVWDGKQNNCLLKGPC